MPSKKRRINLTVSDEIYEQLQKYKLENGLENDATACLQLVVRQLRSEENAKELTKLLHNLNEEQLMGLCSTGISHSKAQLDNLPE